MAKLDVFSGIIRLAEGAPSPSGKRPDRLTPRELQVIKWLGEGLTNRQIANRLDLSARTVDAHLRSIYAKLQIQSRSAATRYAIEHGLS